MCPGNKNIQLNNLVPTNNLQKTRLYFHQFSTDNTPTVQLLMLISYLKNLLLQDYKQTNSTRKTWHINYTSNSSDHSEVKKNWPTKGHQLYNMQAQAWNWNNWTLYNLHKLFQRSIQYASITKQQDRLHLKSTAGQTRQDSSVSIKKSLKMISKPTPLKSLPGPSKTAFLS